MIIKKEILRVVDVNINRTKEGLRVVEDIYRFVIKNDNLRKRIRKIRHDLDSILLKDLGLKVIAYRNSKNDLGKKIDQLELKRGNLSDVLYANFSRVKESLRVLEEFLKILFPKKVGEIKDLRFKVYNLEKISLGNKYEN